MGWICMDHKGALRTFRSLTLPRTARLEGPGAETWHPHNIFKNMIQAEPGFSPSNLSSEGNMFLSPFKSRPELLIFYGFSLAASESKSTVQADCVLSGLWQIVLPPFTFWIPQIRFGWRATIPAAELLAHSVSLTHRSGGLSFCHSIWFTWKYVDCFKCHLIVERNHCLSMGWSTDCFKTIHHSSLVQATFAAGSPPTCWTAKWFFASTTMLMVQSEFLTIQSPCMVWCLQVANLDEKSRYLTV